MISTSSRLRKSISVFFIILFVLLSASVIWAQKNSAAAPSVKAADDLKEKRLQWFRNARFGMMIHWGLYSVPAGEWKGKRIEGLGEWIMNRAKIPVGEYELLAPKFDPEKFNAEEFVRIAKDAGMKYIVITSKHHDGFAMFHSHVSKYNIYDATPFKRDPMKELADAAQKAGLKLCFYYSQTQDWHEPDAVGNDWDFKEESKKSFQKYLDEKVKPQVTELLTNYGPIGLIWFDTPRNITKEQSQELVDLVHKLQPDCLVSGRVGHGLGDYDSAGDNQISMGNAKRIWETPVTMNDTWGFKSYDENWKPVSVLIRQLVQVISQGGNYLLNVGPTSEGLIPQPSVERLAEVGKWLKLNKDAVYGAGPSPFPYDLPWGIITTKPGKMYLHVYNWPQKSLVLYGLKSKVRRAYLLANGRALKFAQGSDKSLDHSEISIRLPAAAPDKNDSVIALDLTGNVEVDASLLQQPDDSVTLPAFLANVHKTGDDGLRFDSRGVAERWTSKDDWLDWNFKVTKPGNFEVVILTSEQKYGRDWEGGHSLAIQTAGKKLTGKVENNGKEVNEANPYWPYVISKMGIVQIDKAGTYSLMLKPESIKADKKLGLTLVSVRLVPVAK
jgi:alpha-L-fucosidase